MKTTPLEIEILIHYHVSGTDFPNLDAPAIKDAIGKFIKMGLLHTSCTCGVKFTANTEATEVYIKALCDVPLPTQKWSV